jgi:hypothetical protein
MALFRCQRYSDCGALLKTRSGTMVDFHSHASGANSMRIVRKWLPAIYPSAFHNLQAHVFGLLPRNVCLNIVGFHLQELSSTSPFHSCTFIHCSIGMMSARWATGGVSCGVGCPAMISRSKTGPKPDSQSCLGGAAHQETRPQGQLC